MTHEPVRKVRVVVAEHHPLYREALARTIAATPELELAGEVTTAPDALTAARELRPDVAVLDVNMPGDGRTVLEALERGEIESRVIALSEHADAPTVRAALRAGAAGFLAKDSSADLIRRSILEVAAGGTAFSGRAQAALDRAPGGVLSDRELQLLHLTAAGLSNAEIGRRLYVSAETVKTHLSNLFRKLGVSDRTAAVAEGLRRGLID